LNQKAQKKLNCHLLAVVQKKAEKQTDKFRRKVQGIKNSEFLELFRH